MNIEELKTTMSSNLSGSEKAMVAQKFIQTENLAEFREDDRLYLLILYGNFHKLEMERANWYQNLCEKFAKKYPALNLTQTELHNIGQG